MNQVDCRQCGARLEVSSGGERTCPICLGPLIVSRPRPRPAAAAPASPDPGEKQRWADTARICPVCADDRDSHAVGCPEGPEILNIDENTAPPPRSASRQVSEDTAAGSVALAAWAVFSVMGMPLVFQMRSSDGKAPVFMLVIFLAMILAYFVEALWSPRRGRPITGARILLNITLFFVGCVLAFLLLIFISCQGR